MSALSDEAREARTSRWERSVIRITGEVERTTIVSEVEVDLTDEQERRYEELAGDERIDFLHALLIANADFDDEDDDFLVCAVRAIREGMSA